MSTPAGPGRETQEWKRDVRKLKEKGLTESLGIGYRLSPRGEAVVDHGVPSRSRAPKPAVGPMALDRLRESLAERGLGGPGPAADRSGLTA